MDAISYRVSLSSQGSRIDTNAKRTRIMNIVHRHCAQRDRPGNGIGYRVFQIICSMFLDLKFVLSTTISFESSGVVPSASKSELKYLRVRARPFKCVARGVIQSSNIGVQRQAECLTIWQHCKRYKYIAHANSHKNPHGEFLETPREFAWSSLGNPHKNGRRWASHRHAVRQF